MATMEGSVRSLCSIVVRYPIETPERRTGSSLRYRASSACQSRSGRQSWSAEVAAGGLHRQHHHQGRWKLERGERFGDLNGFRQLAGFGAAAAAPAAWSLLYGRGGGGVMSPCPAKKNWFGGHQGPEEESVQDESVQKAKWPVLERWDIPWDGKVTSLGMGAWLLSFLLTGLLVAVLAAQIGIGRRDTMTSDEQAIYVFIHQLAQTIAGLAVINTAVAPYKPLPPDLFSIDWKSPFDLQRGWILWGSIGTVCSGAAVVAASYLTASASGPRPPRDEADALVQLMPIIGASPLSTAALIFVTGVLAPILEETIFRGFLMTSLTKWLPTPVAVVISALAFAAAHVTPGEFPQLAALGGVCTSLVIYGFLLKSVVTGNSRPFVLLNIVVSRWGKACKCDDRRHACPLFLSNIPVIHVECLLAKNCRSDTGLFVCSNPQSSQSDVDSFCLELRSRSAFNSTSASRLRLKRADLTDSKSVQ